MAAAPPDLHSVIADGNWLAHRYDQPADAIRFRPVDRAAHKGVTFLTDAELGDGPVASFRRADCLVAVRKLAPPTPRFIIHSAFCCSTMLARAFDQPGVSLGLKEPVILNDVAALQLRRADPRQVAAALDAALWLLARPIERGETMVVKPSNLFNPMLPALLAMRPDAKVLLLHAPLEAYLGSVARKEIEGRAWVRELMWKLIGLGQAERFGWSDEDLYRQTDLQVAALGWLVQQAAFAEQARRHPERVHSLDSETLTHRPAEVMAALRAFFDLGIDAQAIASGPAFREHSKTGELFDAGERDRQRAEGVDRHSREIALVLEWSDEVARHGAIEPALPAALLG